MFQIFVETKTLSTRFEFLLWVFIVVWLSISASLSGIDYDKLDFCLHYLPTCKYTLNVEDSISHTGAGCALFSREATGLAEAFARCYFLYQAPPVAGAPHRPAPCPGSLWRGRTSGSSHRKERWPFLQIFCSSTNGCLTSSNDAFHRGSECNRVTRDLVNLFLPYHIFM